jgi:protein-tyrosine phosphatase
MPGVDDGAGTIDDARAGIAVMWEQGARTIITTPHLSASLTLNEPEFAARLEQLDAAWYELSRMAKNEFPDLSLERGAEVLVDVPYPRLSDDKVRLARSRFVLVEFPFSALPPHTDKVLFDLKMGGVVPIVAHPERYREIGSNIGQVERWRQSGAHIQVNSGSFCGAYGKRAETTAHELLRRGWIDYLGSDYHSHGVCYLSEGARVVTRKAGSKIARLLTEVNAERLLQNTAPLQVEALRQRSWLSRVFAPKEPI